MELIDQVKMNLLKAKNIADAIQCSGTSGRTDEQLATAIEALHDAIEGLVNLFEE